jgi:hypothetical protein
MATDEELVDCVADDFKPLLRLWLSELRGRGWLYTGRTRRLDATEIYSYWVGQVHYRCTLYGVPAEGTLMWRGDQIRLTVLKLGAVKTIANCGLLRDSNNELAIDRLEDLAFGMLNSKGKL